MLTYKYHLRQIEDAAEWLLYQLKDKRILLLEGDMGSGKTSLTTALMRKLGALDPTSSPTYAIVNEYLTSNSTFPLVYHMDLYRIKRQEELEALPLTDYLDSNALCIIEWPELAKPYIDDDYLEVHLHLETDNQRILVIL